MLSNKEKATLTYKALQSRKRRKEAKKRSDFLEFKAYGVRRCSNGKVKMKGVV